MKRLAVFTVLVTITFLAERATNFLTGVATEKRVWIAAVYGGLADLGTKLVLGTLVCTVLYGVASFYEGVLARRQALWQFTQANAGGHGGAE